MAKFFKKPIKVVEAIRWFKNGDHPEDRTETFKSGLFEGKVVRYYRRPDVSGFKVCESCGSEMHDHGWIDGNNDGQQVCPGDYIVDLNGEYLSVPPNIFDREYYDTEELESLIDNGEEKHG